MARGSFVKSLLVFVTGTLILDGMTTAAKNLMSGKDVLGRKKIRKAPEETKVDWKGNIELGRNDYRVV